jgi:hypothetical protein
MCIEQILDVVVYLWAGLSIMIVLGAASDHEKKDEALKAKDKALKEKDETIKARDAKIAEWVAFWDKMKVYYTEKEAKLQTKLNATERDAEAEAERVKANVEVFLTALNRGNSVHVNWNPPETDSVAKDAALN